jgi:hypothetical protein
VFWGQFLSVPLVKRLGPVDQFIAEYRKLEDPVDHDLIKLFSNGSLLIWLSRSAEDFRVSNSRLCPPHFERAAWLYERFEQAGLL